MLYVFLLIILEILGNFLLYCIIYYEKFGMDSQKRTVTNQLFSKMTGVQILCNLFIIPSSFSLLPGLESKFLQLSFSEKITCMSVLVSVCLPVCVSVLLHCFILSRPSASRGLRFLIWLESIVCQEF